MLSFSLTRDHETHVLKGVSAMVKKKCLGWYSQCRSDRSINRPFIWFTMYGEKRISVQRDFCPGRTNDGRNQDRGSWVQTRVPFNQKL
ncbi:hypothetical protein TNCV_98181 [Trichonephila clavipes]|nr:hypothetical protein TNCV_98181 [Trichonephila clavipes]